MQVKLTNKTHPLKMSCGLAAPEVLLRISINGRLSEGRNMPLLLTLCKAKALYYRQECLNGEETSSLFHFFSDDAPASLSNCHVNLSKNIGCIRLKGDYRRYGDSLLDA